MTTQLLCSIPDCEKPTRWRGWCEAHYPFDLINTRYAAKQRRCRTCESRYGREWRAKAAAQGR